VADGDLKQILCVSCDNASNNETMVDELEVLLPEYSPSNRVRCFTHVLNLVAKSLLKQFDVVKKSKNDDGLNEEDHKLFTLAESLEEEELTTANELNDDNGEEGDEDNLEDWVDEVEILPDPERKLLEESVRPVKMVLVKVSHQDILLTRY
jgi:hypothetical protein